ncbi:MAG: CBS domain-containing protein [Gammaproteobacteria bacterium]
MNTLELKHVCDVDHLVHPEEFSDLGWSSPALDVFTDFRYHQPQVIERTVPAAKAADLMAAAHVHLLVVVDLDDEFVGTLNTRQIEQQRLMQQVAKGQSRDSLLVEDVMTHRRDVLALEYEELLSATIGNVVESLREHGFEHCMVVDSAKHQIRGLISTEDIARRIHMPIEVSHRRTFAEIFQAINH